ncbi:MAG: hypothetical protein KAH38_08170 [Candidatus Hydrogenedentes bacterium]|nr:hypothetical protein [Candidatus Hydrogenedentota bacterium]
MNNLGVCIICPAYSKGSPKKTVESVDVLPVEVTTFFVENHIEAAHHLAITNDDWTLILYEWETLDKTFIDAIQPMMEEQAVDAYRFCCLQKTEDTPRIAESIRMYRRGTALSLTAMQPDTPGLNVLRILDGWVFEHGTRGDYCTFKRSEEAPQQSAKGSESGTDPL